MAYHTGRYKNIIATACQVLIQWESFIFVIVCETHGTMDLLCFHDNHEVHSLQGPDAFDLL